MFGSCFRTLAVILFQIIIIIIITIIIIEELIMTVGRDGSEEGRVHGLFMDELVRKHSRMRWLSKRALSRFGS